MEGEGSGLMRIKQREYYVDAGKHLKIYEEHPDVSFSSNLLPYIPSYG